MDLTFRYSVVFVGWTLYIVHPQGIPSWQKQETSMMIQSSNLVNYPGLAGPSFVGLSHVLINYEVGLSSKRTWFSIVGDGDTLIDCCHIRPHPILYPRKTVVFLPHMGSKNIVVSPLTRLGFVYLCYYVLQTMVCIYIYTCV